MKIICSFIVSLLLLSISFSAKSQDSLYATRSVYRCGIHYIILFKYKPVPDSTKTRVIRLRYKLDNGTDSIAHDTVLLKIFLTKAILFMEVPEGTEQLTDPTPVTLELDDRGIFSDFIQRAYDKLCNQPKKHFEKPAAQATRAVVAGHTEHWIPATKRSDNSFWMIGNENKGGQGDTIVLSGKYSYAYIAEDYSSQVVIYTDGKQVNFKTGISVENTTNLKIDGSGGDSLYGINITGGGTNMAITGKSNYIDIGYVDMRNGGVGGIFDKTEVSDVQNKYGCDPSYLYPTRAMYHHLHHLRLRNVQGDGIYEGSTGSTGGRPLTCGGQTTYPKPMRVGFVEIDNIVLDSINRQGAQISGADTGYVLAHDNHITNTGYEYNSQQGAGFSIGSLCTDAKVYNNFFSHNFLYNFYSYGDGVTEFYDNVTDTAGQVGTKGTKGWKRNPEQLSSTLFAPQKKNSALVIKNNVTGFNTEVKNGKPVGFAIYGSPALLNIGGNVFCNNVGNLVNSTGVDFQTSCVGDVNYTISATADENIVITPPGVTAVPAGGSQAYTIAATSGHSVADVKVDGVSIGAATSYIFTNVTANHTIAATSASVTYNIVASSTGGGVVSPPGSTPVPKGTDITYTITPSEGWHTKTLTVDNVAKDASLTEYTFKSVKANHTISATFAENLYSITSSVTSAGGGTIKPYGKITIQPGAKQLFAFKADPGYQLADILIDGESIGVLQQFVFFDVKKDHTIKVKFKLVSGPNLAPVAVPAFSALFSEEHTLAVLSGELSSDSDGNIVTYKWEQLSGDPVTISNKTAKRAQVTGFVPGTYKFQLTVTDNAGESNSATITVVVSEPGSPMSTRFAIKHESPLQ